MFMYLCYIKKCYMFMLMFRIYIYINICLIINVKNIIRIVGSLDTRKLCMSRVVTTRPCE